MIKITPKIKKIIEKNPLTIATVDRSGKPNVSVVAFVKVVSENEVLITDNYMAQTKQNILQNKNVCLAVWDKKWNGVKIIGKTKYFSSGKWKEYVEKMKENKGLSAKGAIIVKISKLIDLK
ncbi:MAG: Pyridoxamine 5'-phosphate oxidase-related FMN-binding protein [Parcubacteria group bacterium GW2011_GWD2_38_11]|nr:MAG: Pyridoxamine 5'-phosphate oxidase-related FMN-binding protein [Parcubacteria group bacterium GW2011_GWD2_38_11]